MNFEALWVNFGALLNFGALWVNFESFWVNFGALWVILDWILGRFG